MSLKEGKSEPGFLSSQPQAVKGELVMVSWALEKAEVRRRAGDNAHLQSKSRGIQDGERPRQEGVTRG